MSSAVRNSVRRALSMSLVLLGVLAMAPALAQAGVGAGTTVSFPNDVTVGQTGLDGFITLTNLNSDNETPLTNSVCNFGDIAPPCGDVIPGGGGILPERGITLVPSCGLLAGGACQTTDPGVFAITNAVGRATGNTLSCINRAFTIFEYSPGRLRLTPTDGGRVLLPGAGATCIIDFDIAVLKTPTIDQKPSTPGCRRPRRPTIASTWVRAIPHPMR